mgnify:CR=1 FL=1
MIQQILQVIFFILVLGVNCDYWCFLDDYCQSMAFYDCKVLTRICREPSSASDCDYLSGKTPVLLHTRCSHTCTSNADCLGLPAATYCAGYCRECCNADDCNTVGFPNHQCMNGLCVYPSGQSCSNTLYCPSNNCADDGKRCWKICDSDSECSNGAVCFKTQCTYQKAVPQCLTAPTSCTSSNDCPTRALPRCQSSQCSACTSDADCTKFSATPYCDSGKCQACKSSTHQGCSGSTPFCMAASDNICVNCRSNSDCTNPSQPRCSSNTCQPCSSNADCTNFGSRLHCDSGTCQTCVAGTNAGCATPSPICISVSGVNSCYECGTNSDCSSISASECTASYSCQACTSHTSCDRFSDTSLCENGICQACLVSSNQGCNPVSTLPVCVAKSSGNECVECGSLTDCTSLLKSSCSNYECIPCQANTECVGLDGLPFCLSGACVTCIEDTDCQPDNNFCINIADNEYQCVKCRDNADCSGSTPICDPALYVCRACQDNECPIDLTCLSNGFCGNCMANTDCGSPALPLCTSSHQICSPCTIDTDCSHLNLNACHSNGTCIPCLSDSYCTYSSAKPVCNLMDFQCVQCTSDTHCQAQTTNKRCKTASVECVQCLSDADCWGLIDTVTEIPIPICNLETNTCKQAPSFSSCTTSVPQYSCISCAYGFYLDEADLVCKPKTPIEVTFSLKEAPNIYQISFNETLKTIYNAFSTKSLHLSVASSTEKYEITAPSGAGANKTYEIFWESYTETANEKNLRISYLDWNLGKSERYIIVRNFSEIAVEGLAWVEAARKALDGSTQAAVAATSVVSGVLFLQQKGYSTSIMRLLLFTSRVNFMKLININYPSPLPSFYGFIDVGEFGMPSFIANSFNNPSERLLEEADTKYTVLYNEYAEFRYSYIFLDTYGGIFFSTLMSFLAYLVFKLIARFFKKREGKIKKMINGVIEMFEKNILTTILITRYLQLSIGTILNVGHPSFQNPYQYVSFFIGIFYGVILIIFWVAAILGVIFDPEKHKDTKYLKTVFKLVTLLYKDFKPSMFARFYAFFTLLFCNFFIMFLLESMRTSPGVQVISITFIQISNVAFTFAPNLFVSKCRKLSIAGTEISLLLITVLNSVMCLLQNQSGAKAYQGRIICSWALIVIVIFTIIYQLVVGIVEAIIDYRAKKRAEKENKKLEKTIPGISLHSGEGQSFKGIELQDSSIEERESNNSVKSLAGLDKRAGLRNTPGIRPEEGASHSSVIGVPGIILGRTSGNSSMNQSLNNSMDSSNQPMLRNGLSIISRKNARANRFQSWNQQQVKRPQMNNFTGL